MIEFGILGILSGVRFVMADGKYVGDAPNLDSVTTWDWYAGQALMGLVLIAQGEDQIALRSLVAAKYADEMMRLRDARKEGVARGQGSPAGRLEAQSVSSR